MANGEGAVIGCALFAWAIYAVLFVAFWGVVAWGIITLVSANS